MSSRSGSKQIEEQVSILADRVDAIKDAIARCEEQIKGITSRFEAQPPTDLEAARSMLAEISKHPGNHRLLRAGNAPYCQGYL